MEHKKIIFINNSGNIIFNLSTNDPSLLLPQGKIALDITNVDNSQAIMLQSKKYKATINKNGKYDIVKKKIDELVKID